MDPTLSLACTLSDRTRPVVEGRIAVPGFRFDVTLGEPEELFRRALRERAFAITELSMGSHIVTTARGDSAYVGVPVFLSRAFRHSGIFVRTDRGIRSPADLRGRRIALPEYQQTAAMWVRGILADECGIDARAIDWVTGSQEVPGGTERVALKLPDDIRVTPIGPDETLNGLLASGAVDALVTPRPPSCFTQGTAPVDRLFPDYRAAETAWHGKTGFFPIMHCLAVRRDVAEAHPGLPRALFEAFAAAKAEAMADLARGNFLRVALPWVTAHLEETRAVMGPNIWAYGLAANHAEIAAMTRFAASDGLAARQVTPEELFHPDTHALSDTA
jgi:4,5-dihydroxyphthalate decarboxylase